MAKHVQCECCGKIWNISVQRDVSKGYICPKCDERMSGKKIKRGNGR